jgi:adenylate cyclase
MSPEPEQDYFCDGISEEITNSLTRVSGLNVIARTSAFHFKGANIDIREVGQRLGANLVIEGSVRKAGEQLRITAQAIQTESGHHIWSETFRRELQDVFAIQEEIAQSVADLLRLHMPEVQGPVRPSAPDLDAYTRYLRARFLIHQQSPETLQAPPWSSYEGSQRPIPITLLLTAAWLRRPAFLPSSGWSPGVMCIRK